MSILTKEQADAVWRARVGVKCEVGKQWTPAADINALLSIIDDLQARAHIIDCEFCDGTGGFQNEQTGEITDCNRCNGSGKHVLQHKQYTEQELRDKFEGQFTDWDAPTGQPEWLARVEGAEYIHPHINSEFVGWLDCARNVGALKAEP